MVVGDVIHVYRENLETNPSLKPKTKTYYKIILDFTTKSWPELETTDMRQLRERLAANVRECFGDEAIADSLHQPNWRGGFHAEKERFACRADCRRY